jgi:hypothetical protein
MTYQLLFKSSAVERYDTDMNERVRMYLENAGFPVVGEFGGTAMGIPADDPNASDNGFEVEADAEIAQRLSHEISALLGGRAVLFEELEVLPPEGIDHA